MCVPSRSTAKDKQKSQGQKENRGQLALVRARETRPLPYNRPEIGVAPARASDVTSPATSCGGHGGSQRCPLADPGEAWGQVVPGAGGGAAGVYQAH